MVSFDAPAGLVSCMGEPLEYSVTLSAGEAGDRACTVARCDYYCSDGITVKSVLKGAGWANNGQKSAGKIRCVEQTRSVKCSACMSGRRLSEEGGGLTLLNHGPCGSRCRQRLPRLCLGRVTSLPKPQKSSFGTSRAKTCGRGGGPCAAVRALAHITRRAEQKLLPRPKPRVAWTEG